MRNGDLVAFPTENSYVVAADPHNDNAVSSFRELKGHDPKTIYPVFVNSIEDLQPFTADVSDKTRLLSQEFWPGMLNLVLSTRDVPPHNFGGTSTPDRLVARKPKNVLLNLVTELVGPLIYSSLKDDSGAVVKDLAKISPSSESSRPTSLSRTLLVHEERALEAQLDGDRASLLAPPREAQGLILVRVRAPIHQRCELDLGDPDEVISVVVVRPAEDERVTIPHLEHEPRERGFVIVVDPVARGRTSLKAELEGLIPVRLARVAHHARAHAPVRALGQSRIEQPHARIVTKLGRQLVQRRRPVGGGRGECAGEHALAHPSREHSVRQTVC